MKETVDAGVRILGNKFKRPFFSGYLIGSVYFNKNDILLAYAGKVVKAASIPKTETTKFIAETYYSSFAESLTYIDISYLKPILIGLVFMLLLAILDMIVINLNDAIERHSYYVQITRKVKFQNFNSKLVMILEKIDEISSAHFIKDTHTRDVLLGNLSSLSEEIKEDSNYDTVKLEHKNNLERSERIRKSRKIFDDSGKE
jgi:hypothetical protein